jgi:hypothetical protein
MQLFFFCSLFTQTLKKRHRQIKKNSKFISIQLRNMAGVSSRPIQSDRRNLETFSLLWLDAQVNTTEENRQAQRKLRQIINHLRTFDDQNECEQYISYASNQDRFVLIVSGRLGRQIVPEIHHLRQLSAIYVYCSDKKLNEEWAKNYTKVSRCFSLSFYSFIFCLDKKGCHST